MGQCKLIWELGPHFEEGEVVGGLVPFERVFSTYLALKIENC